MFLYNITFNIETNIEADWLGWMKQHYIPFVMKTEMFEDYKFFRLLNETENNGRTYSLQFFASSLDHVNTYLEKHAPSIVNLHNNTFKYKHVSFMTILEGI